MLFVGFDGNWEAIIDGLLDVVFLSSSTDGKAEVSDGDSSRSSVGSDGLGGTSARVACVPSEDDLRSGECASEVASVCGTGMVGKIGCGRARLGATR